MQPRRRAAPVGPRRREPGSTCALEDARTRNAAGTSQLPRAGGRKLVAEGLAAPGNSSFFPFGPLVAQARLLPSGALGYDVFSKGFPLRDERLIVIEDLPSLEGFGQVGRVYVGSARGLREWDAQSIDAEAQAQLSRVVSRLRASAVATTRFRHASGMSKKGHKERATVEREMLRQTVMDRDAAQALVDIADRLGPRPGESAVAYRDVLPPLAAPDSDDPVAKANSGTKP